MVLRVQGLTLEREDQFGHDLDDISFEVRAGEVVGIAGVSGNGQQELLYALSGEAPLEAREAIRICGTAAGHLSPGRRRALGLCFVPEERLGRGAVPRMSLARNGLLTAYGSGLLKFGLVRIQASWALHHLAPDHHLARRVAAELADGAQRRAQRGHVHGVHRLTPSLFEGQQVIDWGVTVDGAAYTGKVVPALINVALAREHMSLGDIESLNQRARRAEIETGAPFSSSASTRTFMPRFICGVKGRPSSMRSGVTSPA